MKNDLDATRRAAQRAEDRGLPKTADLIRDLVAEVEELRERIEAFERTAKWSSPSVDDVE